MSPSGTCPVKHATGACLEYFGTNTKETIRCSSTVGLVTTVQIEHQSMMSEVAGCHF